MGGTEIIQANGGPWLKEDIELQKWSSKGKCPKINYIPIIALKRLVAYRQNKFQFTLGKNLINSAPLQIEMTFLFQWQAI